MNAYTNTEFTGFNPVGTAAIVLAESQTQAADILNAELVSMGLPGDANVDDMMLFKVRSVTQPCVRILLDGDY